MNPVRVFYLFILLLVFSSAKSQNLADTISLSINSTGYKFIHQGQKINAKRVMQLMEYNEVAFDEFISAREAYTFGSIFAIIGGGLIIYPFVDIAFGNEPNYGPAFAGVCFIGISVPIFISSNKKTISSISKYNSDLALPLEPIIQSSLHFGTTTSGIGFRYQF